MPHLPGPASVAIFCVRADCPPDLGFQRENIGDSNSRCLIRRPLEVHIRQLAVELAPAGITSNAILAGIRAAANSRLRENSRKRTPG